LKEVKENTSDNIESIPGLDDEEIHTMNNAPEDEEANIEFRVFGGRQSSLEWVGQSEILFPPSILNQNHEEEEEERADGLAADNS
jgi:hypothetical protein